MRVDGSRVEERRENRGEVVVAVRGEVEVKGCVESKVERKGRLRDEAT